MVAPAILRSSPRGCAPATGRPRPEQAPPDPPAQRGSILSASGRPPAPPASPARRALRPAQASRLEPPSRLEPASRFEPQKLVAARRAQRPEWCTQGMVHTGGRGGGTLRWGVVHSGDAGRLGAHWGCSLGTAAPTLEVHTGNPYVQINTNSQCATPWAPPVCTTSGVAPQTIWYSNLVRDTGHPPSVHHLAGRPHAALQRLESRRGRGGGPLQAPGLSKVPLRLFRPLESSAPGPGAAGKRSGETIRAAAPPSRHPTSWFVHNVGPRGSGDLPRDW